MMMIGGGFMMVVGILILFLVVSLPILLFLVLTGRVAGILQNQNPPMPAVQNLRPINYSVARSVQQVSPKERYCTHCGAGLESDWTHCPKCGAPTS